MSTERRDYIVVGADIGFDKYDEDKTDFFDQYSFQDDPGKLTFIIDGMSGEYFVVGEVIAAADYYNDFGVQEIKPDENFESKSERVRQFVRQEFGTDVKPKILVISHYY